MADRVGSARKLKGKPLTLAEKILFNHLQKMPESLPLSGKTYVDFNPDRVAMQDATAQMALLQFMQAGRTTSAVPATIHCDHLICAEKGAKEDLAEANKTNAEVYSFLQSVAEKYGMGFWKPGAGIIHQIILENYAFPGGLMIGTDSHTPNAGGLGMVAIGVGGADAVDVMADMPWELKWPSVVGVHLKGKLNGWASPKDVIIYLLGKLTVKGGTGRIFEYFGEGCEALSCTGKATITNMGAELGATCSIFPFDKKMAAFLRATDREDVADLAESNKVDLVADAEVNANPSAFYTEVIEVDLSALEPHIAGPHTPDLVRPLSKFKEDATANDYPQEISAALVGSCTNASYEDIARAASVAEQALQKGLKAKSLFYITPGSELVYETVKRDGLLAKLEAIGGVLLTNACGQCIGQWNRTDAAKERKNSIITTFNRNFAQRNDGSPHTLAFISSPEVVTAMAIAGNLSFEGLNFKEPTGEELPKAGFVNVSGGLVEGAAKYNNVMISVDEKSNRLQLLDPFLPWNGDDLENLLILLKAKGKCTTDHISPAGKWLKFRGHLDNISNNAFTGAINAFTGEKGCGTNVLSGKTAVPFPEIARDYKSKGFSWIVIGDENYGEGSSREHAAMSPRFLGARAVITRSFARIHETNLKKQGVFPFTFEKPSDYDKIQQNDRASLRGLKHLTPDSQVFLVLIHEDKSIDEIPIKHTLSAQQIEWIKYGSALNKIAADNKA
jgi:aconitate hydratase